MRKYLFYSFLTVFLSFFVVSFSANAASYTFDVNTTLDTIDANLTDGVCKDASNKCSIRAAVMQSNYLDLGTGTNTFTVNIPAGTYTLTIPLSPSSISDSKESEGDINIYSTITFNGASAKTTIIDGGNLTSIFSFGASADNSQINKLTFTGTNNVYEDYAVESSTRYLIVRDSIFRDNAAGGIYLPNASFTLSYTRIFNTAIYNNGGTGIRMSNGADLSLINSVVAYNNIGGIVQDTSVYSGYSYLNIYNSTIAFNVSSSLNLAGGITKIGTKGSISMDASILSNNSASQNTYEDCYGGIYGNSVLVSNNTGCSISGASWNPNLLNVDAQLNTAIDTSQNIPFLSLKNTSPAKDAGTPSTCSMLTDINGVSRAQGTTCDLGAAEIVNPNNNSPVFFGRFSVGDLDLVKPAAFNSKNGIADIVFSVVDKDLDLSKASLEYSLNGTSNWTKLTVSSAYYNNNVANTLLVNNSNQYQVQNIPTNSGAKEVTVSWNTLSDVGAVTNYYYIRVTLSDSNNNTSVSPVGINFQSSVDNVPPTLTLVTPIPSSTTDNTPSIFLKTSDGVTISTSVFVTGSCQKNVTQPKSYTSPAQTFELVMATLPAGTYSNCQVYFKDSGLNSSNVINIPTFTIVGGWTSWNYNQGTTMDPIAMMEFTVNGTKRLFQAVRGSGYPYSIFIRSTADGVFDPASCLPITSAQTNLECWDKVKVNGVTSRQVTLAVFNGRLYIAARRDDAKIYTKSMGGTGVWDANWNENGGTTTNTVAMVAFNSRLYQAVRGNGSNRMFVRSTADGVFDGELDENWVELNGQTEDDMSLAVVGSKLYMTVRGSTGRLFTRSTSNGTTWSAWSEASQILAKTPPSSFGHAGKLYMSITDYSDKIYTRSSVDGITWSTWLLAPGLTSPSRVDLTDFNGVLYHAARSADTKIYTRRLVE